jgi:hypothetical protein
MPGAAVLREEAVLKAVEQQVRRLFSPDKSTTFTAVAGRVTVWRNSRFIIIVLCNHYFAMDHKNGEKLPKIEALSKTWEASPQS